jgi:hypothetical protein
VTRLALRSLIAGGSFALAMMFHGWRVGGTRGVPFLLPGLAISDLLAEEIPGPFDVAFMVLVNLLFWSLLAGMILLIGKAIWRKRGAA